jgi:hypothetical protein
MRKRLYILIGSLLLLVAVWIPTSIRVEGTSPSLTFYPKGTEVSNGTDIVLKMNVDVKSVDKNLINVYFVRSGSKIPVKIKSMTVVDKRDIVIKPAENLLGNKTYTIEVKMNAITLEGNASTFPYSDMTSTFRTNYKTFHYVFVQSTDTLETKLKTLLPRYLTVSAPKRYIEKLSVVHKKKGKLGSNASTPVTNSLTNIDTRVIKSDVNVVEYLIYQQGKLKIKKNAMLYKDPSAKSTTETSLYSLGFAKLPDVFDLHVIAKDSEGKILDKQILKVVSEDGKIYTSEETYDYETAGKSYTLYELLSSPVTFNKLLEENDMTQLMFQERRPW